MSQIPSIKKKKKEGNNGLLVVDELNNPIISMR